MPNDNGKTKVKRPKYLLIGLAKTLHVVFLGADSVEELTDAGEPLLYFSVYVNRPGLWTSVQREYLVTTKGDPLWVSIPAEMSVQ